MGSNENLNINPSGPGAPQASNTAEALKPSVGSQVKGPINESHHRLPDESVNTSGVQQSPRNAEVGSEERNIRKNLRKQNNNNRTQQQRFNRFKLKPHQVYQHNQQMLEQLFANKYYKKFFVIKAKSSENLAEINVIKANKQLENILKGKPKKINELRDESLLVEVKDEEQSLRIKNINKLDKVDVTVVEHESLNRIKGTIKYKNQPRYKTEEILEALREQVLWICTRWIEELAQNG